MNKKFIFKFIFYLIFIVFFAISSNINLTGFQQSSVVFDIDIVLETGMSLDELHEFGHLSSEKVTWGELVEILTYMFKAIVSFFLLVLGIIFMLSDNVFIEGIESKLKKVGGKE